MQDRISKDIIDKVHTTAEGQLKSLIQSLKVDAEDKNLSRSQVARALTTGIGSTVLDITHLPKLQSKDERQLGSKIYDCVTKIVELSMIEYELKRKQEQDQEQ